MLNKAGSKAWFVACHLILMFSAPWVIAEGKVKDQLAEVKKTKILRVNDTSEMSNVFSKNGLTLKTIKQDKTVARIFVDAIPADLHQRAVTSYKELYILLLLPNVMAVNESILLQRHKLLGLINKKEISSAEKSWLQQLKADYRGEGLQLEALLQRVDIIPPSLAIAQSINETAWGSSRFAQHGNALFGQHLPKNSQGDFIQARGANVKMAAFSTPLEAVRSYMHNLNTSRAYIDLRRKRQALRLKSKRISATELAQSLLHYSERGQVYVDSLTSLIRSNHLAELDNLTLLPLSTASPIQLKFK